MLAEYSRSACVSEHAFAISVLQETLRALALTGMTCTWPWICKFVRNLLYLLDHFPFCLNSLTPKKPGTICFCIRKIRGYVSVFQKQNRYQKIEAPRQAVWRISCVTSGKSLYPSEPVSQMKSLPSLTVTLRMLPTMIPFPNCPLGISCFPPKVIVFLHHLLLADESNDLPLRETTPCIISKTSDQII